MQERLHHLREMFPRIDPSRIEEVIMLYGVEEGVGILLEESPEDDDTGTGCILDLNLPIQSSLQTILFELAHKTMNHSGELFLKVNKDTLWQQALPFYKELKADEIKLHKNINVEFEGEEGSDAGALKVTFFEMLIREVNHELFEGKDDRQIPKKDWGLDGVMEIAGVMVGHSIMCGGPGFDCLHPAYYYMLHSGATTHEAVPSEFIPSVEDIPESLAYCDLLELIQQVRVCSTCILVILVSTESEIMFSRRQSSMHFMQ